MNSIASHTPETKCPNCGHKLNRATALEGDLFKAPKAGDFTICIRCAALLRFDSNLLPVSCEIEDLKKLDREQQHLIVRAQQKIREMRAEAN